jgi:ribosomal protein S18 acetylase RimI-like enzyme
MYDRLSHQEGRPELNPGDVNIMELKISDAIEIAARRDFFAAATEDLGCEILPVPRTTATLLRARCAPLPVMNRVVGLVSDDDLSADTLNWIAQAFREVAIGQIWVSAWDHPAGAVIVESLGGWNPEPVSVWSKFLLNLDEGVLPLPQTGKLHLRRARLDEAALAGEIVTRCVGLPPEMAPWLAALVGRPNWQVYVACNEHDEPVAAASLFIDGLRAWIGMGATLPEARGQGAQQMLMSMRLLAAKAAGCIVVGVEAEAARSGQVSHSINNIHRAGFREVGTRTNYLCTI